MGQPQCRPPPPASQQPPPGEQITASGENATASGETATASGEAATASGEQGAPPSQDQLRFGAFGLYSPEVKAFVTDAATKANEFEAALTSQTLKPLILTTQAGVSLLQSVPVKTENAFRAKMHNVKSKLAQHATPLNNILNGIGPDQQEEDLRREISAPGPLVGIRSVSVKYLSM